MKKFLTILPLTLLFLIPNYTILANNQASTQQEKNTPTNQIGQRYTMVLKYKNAIQPSQGIFEVKPKETFKTELLIKNLSTIPLNFIIYTADEQKTKRGKFSIKMKNDKQEEFGSWAKIEPTKIKLEPDQVKEALLKITAPTNNKKKTYYGGIVIEKAPEKSKQKGVSISTRIALKASITVTPTPYIIPLQAKEYIHPPLWKALLLKYYFYISLALFIGSMFFLKLATKNEKKKHKKKK